MLSIAVCITLSIYVSLFTVIYKLLNVLCITPHTTHMLCIQDDPICPTLICEVTCQVVRPEKASSTVTNTFYFIFGFFNQSVHLRRVLPSTLDEAKLILQVSRRDNLP